MHENISYSINAFSNYSYLMVSFNLLFNICRWIIDPPLDIVVPSRSTPWRAEDFVPPTKISSSPPPPPPLLQSTNIANAKQRRNKSSKGGKGRKSSRRTKPARVNTDSEQW